MPAEDYSDVFITEPSSSENEDSKNESRIEVRPPPKLKCLLELDYLFEEERENIIFKHKVTRVLNKITRKSFHEFVKLFEKLLSNNAKRYDVVFNMLVDRAINEPLFCPLYVDLATMIRFSSKESTNEAHFYEIYGVGFSTKILELFREIPNIRPLNANETEAEFFGTMSLEERKRINRLKSIGVCRIIGELYKIGMIDEGSLKHHINRLLHYKDDDIFLECLYVLFTTIGRYFQDFGDTEMFDEYFDVFEDIVRKENAAVSNRIRILLLNLIDLKRKSWVSTKKSPNIKQIRNDD